MVCQQAATTTSGTFPLCRLPQPNSRSNKHTDSTNILEAIEEPGQRDPGHGLLQCLLPSCRVSRRTDWPMQTSAGSFVVMPISTVDFCRVKAGELTTFVLDKAALTGLSISCL